MTACCRALDRAHLHYVGIYQGGQLAWCADIFDDPGLAPLFQRVTPGLRRRGYSRLMSRLHIQARRLGSQLKLTGSDTIIRLVLDVARSTIYVVPLNDDDYLVGVTLLQSRTAETDRQIMAVRDELAG